MRAGLLKYFVDIYRYVNVTSESGMRSRVRQDVCTLRCQLMKQKGVYIQSDNEEYDSTTIILQTWFDPRVKDTDTVCFCGQEFKIVLIDFTATDRTMRLTCKKILK